MASSSRIFSSVIPLLGQSSVACRSSVLLCRPSADWSLSPHLCRCFGSAGEWQHAVSAAEKLVGYPTSYLTLRSLLSDEMSNVAAHLRKLITTTHPLVETAKQLVVDGPQAALQTRGLLVLLVSKAAGLAGAAAEGTLQQDTVAGLMHSQRSLAEITEMIHTAELIHKGVINIHTPPTPDLTPPPASPACPSEANSDHLLGNKLAILCGDYLLANACKELAALRNSEVVELVSSAISDFTESEFLGERDDLGRPLLAPDADVAYWRSKTFLAVGSLLAKACKSALLLAGHTEAASLDLAYALGRHTALAWQGRLEQAPFRSPPARDARQRRDTQDPSGKTGAQELLSGGNPSSGATSRVDVTSLPVVGHLQQLRRLDDVAAVAFCDALQRCRHEGGDVDGLVVREVLAGGAGMQVARQVVQEHCQEALRLLQLLPPSEARAALSNIITALEAEQH